MNNFELVIFDLDGTLCDSFEDIYGSLKYSLEYNNLFVPSKQEVLSFIGDGLSSLIERALNVSNNVDKKDKVIKNFMIHYENHCVVKSKLFDGMDNILSFLRQNNIKMAVISNKAYNFVSIILKQLKIDYYFNLFYGGDSFSEKKPSPMPLISAINNLNINSNNVLMVGDSDNDILAGLHAGVKTCYCSYGYSKLKLSKPDYIINKPIDLKEIILKGF